MEMAPPARRVLPARALAAPDLDPIGAEPAIPMKSPKNVERATPVEAADASDSGTRFKSEEGNTYVVSPKCLENVAISTFDAFSFNCETYNLSELNT